MVTSQSSIKSVTTDSPTILLLQKDEGITIESSHNLTSSNTPAGNPKTGPQHEENLLTLPDPVTIETTAASRVMEKTLSDFTQTFLENPDSLNVTQLPSPRFSQFIRHHGVTVTTPSSFSAHEQRQTLDCG